MKRGLLAVVFLCGCATANRDLSAEIDSWRNATYDEVVARWGRPVSGEKPADGEARTWVSEGARWQPGPAVGVGVFGGGRGSGVGVGASFPFGFGSSAPLRCERTLQFKDGRVVDQRWTGPADFCAGFRRN